MKRMRLVVLVALLIGALAAAVPAAALPGNSTALNARFMHWQEVAAVIHILAWEDDGRFWPAVVGPGQPLLFGVEWVTESAEDYTVTVSVDGGAPIDITSYLQPAFVAATQSGPAWSWDHDGDGPGDGDGDGIGDWSGTIVFFRYPYPGLRAVGSHTFYFLFDFGDGTSSDGWAYVEVRP